MQKEVRFQKSELRKNRGQNLGKNMEKKHAIHLHLFFFSKPPYHGRLGKGEVQLPIQQNTFSDARLLTNAD